MTQKTLPTPSAETPVQALLAKYQSDPAFKAAFDAAGPTEAAVQVAAQYGLNVTLRDVQALGPASEDLSDALLMNIAGGVTGHESLDSLNYTFG